MPYVENSSDLADAFADMLGIYRAERCPDEATEDLDAHTTDCDCRVFWVPAMGARIRAAAQNDRQEGREEGSEMLIFLRVLTVLLILTVPVAVIATVTIDARFSIAVAVPAVFAWLLIGATERLRRKENVGENS